MTVTDQIKILNSKNKQNESQYGLDREAAKITALSSNNLDKYELLTGEDLGLKPSTIEQAKFEYSPLGKIFNKGLSEEDKKEGILKGLVNIKDKNEELINTINTTNRATKNKINIQSKSLFIIVSIVLLSTEILMNLKNCPLILFTKNNKFNDEITSLENVSS